MKTPVEVIDKLATLEGELEEIEQREIVDGYAFALGYKAALRWMLSE